VSAPTGCAGRREPGAFIRRPTGMATVEVR
jgi:hypothetical protein